MITLLQLEYFARLCKTQHITQTAKELYISQTALSSMIIGLEKELGVRLFDREGRSIRLNAAGETYYKYVEEALTAIENGQRALQAYQSAKQSEISLAVGSSLVWLPMLHAFHSDHPNYTVRQFNWSLTKLQSGLQKSEVDFVIAGLDDFPHDQLEWVELLEDRSYLCVSPLHALAERESVRMEELRNESFISLTDDSPWRKFCNKIFECAGFPCHIVLECDYSLRASLIESNFGVALTSESARAVDLLKPNRYIPIEDDYTRRKMALFWNKRNQMTEAAREFREFCPAYYRGIRQTGAD